MEGRKKLIIDIIPIYLSIFLSSIPFGMMSCLAAIKMEHHVGNSILISLCSATQILSGVFISKYLPGIARIFGTSKAIYLSTITAALASLAMYKYEGYFLWIIVIFSFGASIFCFSVIRQTIILDMAPPNHRAILVSTGGMFMSIGNALGPIILNYVGHNDFLPHLVAALFYISSIFAISYIGDKSGVVKENKRIGLFRYIRNSPKIMFGGFTFSYSQASINAFLIIYGIKSGMMENQASLLFSVLLFGTIFSLPMGYLTDTINRRFLMIFSSFGSLVCAILLLLTNDLKITYALLFLMFGLMIGIKLPALILINEKYKPTQRLAVNSAFSRFCFIGSICGIFCTGAIMELIGPYGLWISVILILFLYLSFSICNYWHKFVSKTLLFNSFFIKNNPQIIEEEL